MRKLLIITMLTLACLLFTQSALAVDYILSEGGNKIPISTAYQVKRLIYAVQDEKATSFSKPTDMVIGPDDCLYVLDAGNDRVVKLSLQGKTLAVFTDFGGKKITGATGLCVDRYNEIFIADPNNARVVHISSNGQFVEQFVQPNSKLLDTTTYPFMPTKVAIDPLGYLNILNGEDYHGIIAIDGNNEFRGYVGTNKVGYNLGKAIVQMFATDEQKEQLAKNVPAYFTNVFIDEDGYYYTTVTSTATQQIKKLNAVGVNIYANNAVQAYGENGEGARLVDLTVDSNGVVTAVDQLSGKIYQYDREGNLLCIFGGIGNTLGTFTTPVAIDGDSDFNIYVLDKERGMIQVFERTAFMALVHEGLACYDSGRYDEAQAIWEHVLNSDSTYLLAYIHMGNVLYKQEDWLNSMKMYEMADDKELYSRAFESWKKDMFRQWFVPVMSVACCVLYLLFRLLMKGRKTAREIVLRGVNVP